MSCTSFVRSYWIDSLDLPYLPCFHAKKRVHLAIKGRRSSWHAPDSRTGRPKTVLSCKHDAGEVDGRLGERNLGAPRPKENVERRGCTEYCNGLPLFHCSTCGRPPPSTDTAPQYFLSYSRKVTPSVRSYRLIVSYCTVIPHIRLVTLPPLPSPDSHLPSPHFPIQLLLDS